MANNNVIVLPPEGVSIGNLITGGTAGSVLFIDASGNIGQDNANLNWNNANDTLTLTGASDNKRIVVKAYSSQSAALIEFDDSSNNRLSCVGSDGSLCGPFSGAPFYIFLGRGGTNNGLRIAREDAPTRYIELVPDLAGASSTISSTLALNYAQPLYIGGSDRTISSFNSTFTLNILAKGNSVIHTTDTTSIIPMITRGIASQTAVLHQFQGVSSTSTNREQVDLDTAWVDSTDATRKARFIGRVWDTAAREFMRADASGSAAKIGFLGSSAVVQQTSGANLTNSVTSGGTDDTIANYTDLVIYANDAAAIRNDIYQLARKLKQINDALRLYGLLT